MSRIAASIAVAALCSTTHALAGAEIRDAGALPVREAKDPSAPPITEENLLAGERFWPYRAQVVGRDSATALPRGAEGVLVRVEEGGRARIDFGRDGVHVVPVAITNIVEAANRVRTGVDAKPSPNLTLAIGPRLDGAALGLRRVPLERTLDRRGFLAVYADPSSEEFGTIAASLAPLQDHPGVLTVLFPQRNVDENSFGARLSALGWRIPYVFDYLALGYTDALVGLPLDAPRVALYTAEGRELIQGPWSPRLAADLEAALARHFPPSEGAPRGSAQR